MAGPDDSLSRLTTLASADADAVMAFLDSMPEGDRTFFKDGDDRETVERWTHDSHALRWILPGDGEIAAYLAVIPGTGWSSHVGELRLVVGGGYRRRGLGRRLARRGLLEALQAGLDKIVVEVVADKQGDIEMFTSIGFTAEALLTNQIRDRTGQTRDLVILAHDVAAVRDSMEILGIDEAAGVSATGSASQ
jgi:ribosomal protein S18 acetylase RimI-like enzyme